MLDNQKTHFEADLDDGTTYIQGDDDLSIDTEGKNAFYDILQRLDKVVRFHIVKGNGTRYTVDLTDGHFEVNEVPFVIHDQFYEPKGKLKLIFFKEMHRNALLGGTVHEDGSVEQKMEEQEPYCNRYFIGWEDEQHKHAQNNQELYNPDKAVANSKATLAIPGKD